MTRQPKKLLSGVRVTALRPKTSGRYGADFEEYQRSTSQEEKGADWEELKVARWTARQAEARLDFRCVRLSWCLVSFPCQNSKLWQNSKHNDSASQFPSTFMSFQVPPLSICHL